MRQTSHRNATPNADRSCFNQCIILNRKKLDKTRFLSSPVHQKNLVSVATSLFLLITIFDFLDLLLSSSRRNSIFQLTDAKNDDRDIFVFLPAKYLRHVVDPITFEHVICRTHSKLIVLYLPRHRLVRLVSL
jgi:hypothetical protein